MDTPTVIALVIVGLVVIGGVYIATRPSTAGGAGGLALGDGGGVAGGAQAEGAQYITAGGNAVGAILQGVGSLYSNIGRQAGGSSAGAAK